MSEAMARHLLECVKGGADVSFNVGRFRIVITHKIVDEEDHLYFLIQNTSLSVRINDIGIVSEGYLRIELDDEVLIGLPFEEASE